VHDAGAGETQRLMGSAFETRPQRQMLALDLLHRELSHRVLRGRQMPPIDTRLVRVVTRETKWRQQGAELQELRILPGTHDVGEHSARVMIKRMPEPPRVRFSVNKTPSLIQLGGAPRLGVGAAGAETRRREQRGGGVL
jgi:hypothetical protein